MYEYKQHYPSRIPKRPATPNVKFTGDTMLSLACAGVFLAARRLTAMPAYPFQCLLTAITLSTDRLAIPANGIAFGREPLQLSAGKPDKGVCFEYF
jgi:hypothetical protein